MIRQATDADMPKVISLLESASLPTSGISEHINHLYVLEEQGDIIGAVAYEAYHQDALLRSLVVSPLARGKGYGRKLMSFILEKAKLDGIRNAYALTITIPDLLDRSGFKEISRSEAPETLLKSEEFRGACPCSARLFRISVL